MKRSKIPSVTYNQRVSIWNLTSDSGYLEFAFDSRILFLFVLHLCKVAQICETVDVDVWKCACIYLFKCLGCLAYICFDVNWCAKTTWIQLIIIMKGMLTHIFCTFAPLIVAVSWYNDDNMLDFPFLFLLVTKLSLIHAAGVFEADMLVSDVFSRRKNEGRRKTF